MNVVGSVRRYEFIATLYFRKRIKISLSYFSENYNKNLIIEDGINIIIIIIVTKIK